MKQPDAFRVLSRWCLLTLVAACLSAQQPANPPPANTESPAAVDATDTIFALRRQGDLARTAGDLKAAAQFYTQYLERAYHQDILTEAADRLVRVHLLQGNPQAAQNILTKLPENLKSLKSGNNQVFLPGNTARLKLLQGMVLYSQGDLEASIAAFQPLTDALIDPAVKGEAFVGLGENYNRQENWAEAIKAFQSAMALDLPESNIERAIVGLARCYIMQTQYKQTDDLVRKYLPTISTSAGTNLAMLQVFSLLEQNKAGEAYQYFRDNFAGRSGFLTSDEHVDIARKLAQELSSSKDYVKAQTLLQSLRLNVVKERHLKTLLIDLAEVAAASGDQQASIRHYVTFAQLYPQDARMTDVRFRLGELSVATGGHEAAIDWYQAIFDSPAASANQKFEAAIRMGWICRDPLKVFERAIGYYERASGLEVDDEHKARAYFNRAECLVQLSNFTEAAAQFAYVADQYKTTTLAPEARYQEALAHTQSRLYERASLAFAMYLERYSEGERAQSALLEKGLAERRGGLDTQARATLLHFVDSYPEHPKAALALLRASEAASALGLHLDAIDLLSRIIESYPNEKEYPYALYKRAYIRMYDESAYYEQAVADCIAFYDKYGAFMPELAPNVLMWLGDSYAARNQYDEAGKYFSLITRNFPTSPDAPAALYEVARNAFRRKQLEEAKAACAEGGCEEGTFWWLDRDFEESMKYMGPKQKAKALEARTASRRKSGTYSPQRP